MGTKFSKKLPKQKKQILTKEQFQQGCTPPLLAKSKQRGGTTLQDHLLEAASMALTITTINQYPPQYEQLLQITAFTSALFHDIGKAAAGFQEMLKNDQIFSWPDLKRKGVTGFRHEILSAVIFKLSVANLPKWQKHPDLFQAAFLAIISHHKAYRIGQRNYPKTIPIHQWPPGAHFKIMYEQLYLNHKLLQQLWTHLIEILKEDTWALNLLGTWIPEKLTIPSLSNLPDIRFDNIIPGYKNGRVDVQTFQQFITTEGVLFKLLLKALINTGDHLSSGSYFNPPPIPEFAQYEILPPSINPYPYQQKCRQTSGHVLLRAPTGSGKSEAFGLWIQQNQLHNEQLSKVFVILPFQASSNAMYKRINSWLVPNSTTTSGLVGLNHSRAATVLYSLIEEELYGDKNSSSQEIKQTLQQNFDPWINLQVKSRPISQFSSFLLKSGEERPRKLKGSTKKKLSATSNSLSGLSREIFYPVKITTPYQLLKGLLQGRGWESIVSEFYNACFVYDEIHAYDPNIVGLILRMSTILIEYFNAKIMFMSATFPDFLISLIQETIPFFHDHPENFIVPDPSNPIDAELLNRPRHIVQTTTDTLLSALQSSDVQQRINNEESVLIICNTVRTAQTAYTYLQQKYGAGTVLLFHSRFKLADRREKESILMRITETNYKIVVATQVVEVSLDIDFAFGIIETAPLDAIIQRLGRINRKGKRPLIYYNILLTAMEDNTKYVYNSEKAQRSLELLQDIEGQKISESQLVSLVNQLYTEFPWTSIEWEKFQKAYNHPELVKFTKYLVPGSYKYWIDDVLDIDVSTDVILKEDESIYIQQRKYNAVGNTKLLIPIRLSRKTKQFLSFENKQIPPVLMKYQYSSEFGLQIGDAN